MKVQVSFDGNCKIWKAASSDNSRPVLQTVKLCHTFGKWQLVATDGFILAMVPVELEPEPDTNWSVIIEGSVLESIAKDQKYKRVTFTVDDSNRKTQLVFEYGTMRRAVIVEVDADRYPEFAQIVPRQDQLVDSQMCAVPVDYQKLTQLVEAIGAKTNSRQSPFSYPTHIVMRQLKEFGPIVVHQASKRAQVDGPLGIIMPVQWEKA